MHHTIENGLVMREAGARRGAPTVLWIHGLGESGLCFEGVLDRPELVGWRHLVPDLPGYGRTPWPDTVLDLAATADLLSIVVDEPVVLAGHSLGGVVALLMAERHPHLVRAVVDIDGNTSEGDCTFSSQAAVMDLGEFEQGGFDRVRDGIYRHGLSDPAQRGYYASLRQAHPATFHRHSQELVRWSEARDLARRRAAVACPLLYIAGDPGGACRESRQLLDAARVRVAAITPAGHWPFIDQPDAFVEVLAGFLGELG